MPVRLLSAVAGAGALEAAQDVEALAAAGAEVPRPVLRAACGTDAAPRAWARELAAAEEIWVPGAFTATALEAAGADPARMRVVPPVVDTDAFSPAGPPARPADARGHVLLALVDWVRASGWDLLLRAYAREFSGADDVTLVLRAWSSLGSTAHSIGEMAVEVLEADGHDVGAAPDVIIEVAGAHARPEPSVYRGADCVVAPARADAWGRRPLEAMACGVPVIATAWGIGESVLVPGSPLALPAAPVEIPAIGGREIAPLGAGRWGEPDAEALRRLLRASYEGDPAFAAAGAAGREHVLAHHAAARPAVPPAAPRAARPAAPRAEDVVAGRFARPRSARPERPLDPREVSFVLQGPVERTGPGRTALACEAIRAHFPGAEIVVSTWAGASTSGLDADAVVLSEDPGPVGRSHFNANTNRQLVSSLAGVRATSRDVVVKLRSDLLMLGDVLLDQWDPWEARADELRVFERRVLACDVFTRRPSYASPYPLHPSDWAFAGLRGDLETLFGAPAMREQDTVVPGPPADELGRIWTGRTEVPHYTPEQWIWVQAMRRADPDLALAHMYDLTPETLRATELSFANNLVVLDTYRQFGFWCPKYPWANRKLPDVTLLEHEHWRGLYDRYCREEDGPHPDALLARLAKGRTGSATREDAEALRRAGLPWAAQLLECLLAGPRIWRDPTTGGAARWAADQAMLELAATDLRRAASAARLVPR